MPRSHVFPALLAASLLACAPDHPAAPSLPTTADAAAKKPGGGGGGTSGPVGQLLGIQGGSRANAVNAGYVVGRAGSTAAAWDAAGQTLVLPVTGPVATSTAYAINTAGLIVGLADASAVRWRPASPGAWSAAEPLPFPPGTWSDAAAFSVNDQGSIAGTGTRDGLRYALRWTPVGDGYAVEVVPAPGAEYEFAGQAIANGTGWVTGWVRRIAGGTIVRDGFVWTASGSFHILPRLNNASMEGRGINASGRIAGWAATAPRGGDSSPVTWTCTETGCSAPAVLPMFYRNLNLAFSINDAGDIVGTSGLNGILYSRCGTTVTLNPPAGWHQSYGWAVSGDGTAAAGYSFPEGGTTMQATRWQLPSPTC